MHVIINCLNSLKITANSQQPTANSQLISARQPTANSQQPTVDTQQPLQQWSGQLATLLAPTPVSYACYPAHWHELLTINRAPCTVYRVPTLRQHSRHRVACVPICNPVCVGERVGLSLNLSTSSPRPPPPPLSSRHACSPDNPITPPTSALCRSAQPRTTCSSGT